MSKKIILAIIAVLVITIIMYVFLPKTVNAPSENLPIENANTTNKLDIFEAYQKQANSKLETLTLEEKIGQIFLVRYPDKNAEGILNKYKFGGYLLFEKDFKGKTSENVKNEIARLQAISDIPLLIAVDEEGGKVVRVSSNQNLAPERFKSSSELYATRRI